MTARALTLLLALLLAGCPASSGRVPDADGKDWTPPTVAADDAAATAKGVNQFAIDLHRELGKEPGDVFFSPASIAAAFGMTLAGAEGATADQLAKALHLTLPPEKAHPALGGLLAAQQAQGDPTVAVGNRLWGAQGEFLPSFLALTRDAYGAEVGRVDFRGDPAGARKAINAWIEERTRERIKDLVPEGAVTPLTRLVLTNAIYFKGTWKTKFEKDSTRPGAFTLSSGEKANVPLMHGKMPARFLEGEGFTLGELPYVGERLSLVVLVPTAHDGLPALEARLSADELARWIGAADPGDVQVTLPRLKIERAVSLKEPLMALGVTDAFDDDKADFSGMNSKDDLYVTAALHQAFVEINEEGTEAAAATAVIVGVRSAPRVDELRADRPFLFLIRDTKTGLILFMGRETDPRS